MKATQNKINLSRIDKNHELAFWLSSLGRKNIVLYQKFVYKNKIEYSNQENPSNIFYKYVFLDHIQIMEIKFGKIFS